jgi:hypothetical protein
MLFMHHRPINLQISVQFSLAFTRKMLLDTSYDLTSKWPDLDFEDFSKDVTRGQPADYSSDCKNTDDDDADSEKNGYGCDTDGLTKYLNEDMTTRAHQGNNTLTQRQLAQQPKRSFHSLGS